MKIFVKLYLIISAAFGISFAVDGAAQTLNQTTFYADSQFSANNGGLTYSNGVVSMPQGGGGYFAYTSGFLRSTPWSITVTYSGTPYIGLCTNAAALSGGTCTQNSSGITPLTSGSHTLTFTNSNAALTGSAYGLFFGSTGGVTTYSGFSGGSNSGPLIADTQASLVNTASALQSATTLQNTVMVNGFTYDCPIFNENGICVSAGGRNTQVSAGSINNTSALLIGSYRLDANNSRIGLSLDQNVSTSMPGGTIKQSNSTPMVGVFGVWQENLDNTGWEGKLSAAMGQKDTTIQRTVVGTSEPGVGSATMLSQGAQATAKYGFALMSDVTVLPYAGLRYTRNNMGGYTEATSTLVTAPLVMAPVNTNSSAALIGLEGRYKVLPDVMTFASAGVERNMSTNYNQYVAVNYSSLTPVSMNPNMVRTRPTATVGAYYDVEKNQRLGVTGIYRQEMYQAVGTTTVMATYTVGL